MKYIFSIDVGWKHLAYCFYEKTEKNILKWEIVNVCSEDVNVNTLSIENLIETCKEGIQTFVNNAIYEFQKNNYENVEIFIESQPMGPFTKNIKTKILSHLLQYLFSIHAYKINFISSKKKLKAVSMEKVPYQKLKKMAVEHATELLQGEWKEKFIHLKGKKDDLADCFLQAYYG